MPVASLEHRAILAASGVEARSFLNGLITHDVLDLQSGQSVWAGLLTPQGKALFDFIVYGASDDMLLIEAEASRLPDLVRRLTMYKLRAAVTLTPRPDLHVYAGWGEGAPDGSVRDPRLDAMGWRWISDKSLKPTVSSTDYGHHRLLLGIPEGSADIGIDSLLWLETNADKLNGVSFTKGCYVGQENTARMFHRGKVRKRLMALRVPSGVADGTTVTSGDSDAGRLHSHNGEVGIALIRLDFVNDALMIAGKTASIIPQAWLKDA